MARSQNHNGRIVAFFARHCRLLFKIRSAGSPEKKQPALWFPECRLLFAICALYFHGSHGVAPPYPRFRRPPPITSAQKMQAALGTRSTPQKQPAL